MLFNHADAAAHFMRRKCSILPTPLLNLCGRGAQFRAMYSFRDMYPVDDDDAKKREIAFENLQKLRRNIPDIDEKKELDEYRTMRFGI